MVVSSAGYLAGRSVVLLAALTVDEMVASMVVSTVATRDASRAEQTVV